MPSYQHLVESLSDKDILSKFPDIIPISNRPNSKSSDTSLENEQALSLHNEEQIKLMNENCIIVDYNDNIIATTTKKNCHLLTNIQNGLLHRAFSVFIFDPQGKLLLQKRSKEKITFPLLWTNTCCSHPLSIDNEIGSTNNNSLELNVRGVTNAAIRKLDHELGIPTKQLQNNGSFHFLNRIHYMAPCNDKLNIWAEHEIDYILIYKIHPGMNLTLSPNYNEIDDFKFVSKQEFTQMLNTQNNFTPWFKIICENYLFKWWDQLNDLSNVENDPNIYRML